VGLRAVAEADLATILEDKIYGFGWDISVTDPAGATIDLVGFSRDISQVIDPDTGESVSGRFATVALRISSLIAGGLTLPEGIADAGQKPWVIQFNDINGFPFIFKVSQSRPDRALGIVTCVLENYS
jgi:hypothetical protein